MARGPGQMPNQQHPGMQQMGGMLANSTAQVPQAFNPQLRQPMQASPLPGNVPNPQQGLVAPQMQNQMSQQGQAQRQMANGPIQQMVRQRAQELMSKATPQQLEIAKQFISAMPAERRQQLQSQGIQPAQVYFTELARKQIQEAAQNPQNAMMMNQGQSAMQQNMSQIIQQRLGGVPQTPDLNLQALLGQQNHAMAGA